MKKILFFFILILFSYNSIAQDAEKQTNSEIKLNVAYLIAGMPEIGYEYILNKESSVGADILITIDNDIDIRFAFTPYYRFFFGKKRAAGFFVEGFGMLNTTESDAIYYYDSVHGDTYDSSGDNITDFALGVAVGGKFLTNSGFLFEIYGGVGRNLFNNNDNYSDFEFMPRFGVTVGKRF